MGSTVTAPDLPPLPESVDDAIKVFFVATIRGEHATQTYEALAGAIRAALAAERAAAVQEERVRIRRNAHRNMFAFRLTPDWPSNSSEKIADVLLGTASEMPQIKQEYRGELSPEPCKRCGKVDVWVKEFDYNDQDTRITCHSCRYYYLVDGPDA